MQQRTLMTFNEFKDYLGISERKARCLTYSKNCNYVVHIGRRVFIHKELLDKELERAARYRIPLG